MLFGLLLLLFTLGTQASNEIDPSKTIVWGPGLKPDRITMRARYVFLQLVDYHGQNLTTSPGDKISAQLQGQTAAGHKCHIWTQVLDCKDGSFIVRYKFHTTCFHVELKIKLKEGDARPILSLYFAGPIYEDECNCPVRSVDKWLSIADCPQSYDQIISDLEPFPYVNFDDIRETIIKRYDQPGSVSLCHYVIKDNKVFRTCYGRYVGFKIFMDAILLSLTRKVVLPDVEFFVNLGDWPLVPNTGAHHPIFSWCGSLDTKDIVMPTYDLTESSLEAMGRVMLDMLSVQGNTDVLWEDKIEKLFWQGRDSRRERLRLIEIARENPGLINASITNFFFFKDEMEKYGPGAPHVSFFSFFRYKYQFNIDGTVASYRFPYLLGGDSVVLKQDSKYYEFFYGGLTPMKHYIPVKNDLSDLVERIVWAKEHDPEARAIAKAGRQFARDNLLPQHILCYHVFLFNEWSKRLKSEVRVLDNMEEVPQLNHSCKCHIDGDTNSKDEL